MKTIDLSKVDYSYCADLKMFYGSELQFGFDTTYTLVNPKTGGSMVFELSHSTGSEWDVDTRWIYKSIDGYTLSVGQDAKVTKERAKSYLEAKLRK